MEQRRRIRYIVTVILIVMLMLSSTAQVFAAMDFSTTDSQDNGQPETVLDIPIDDSNETVETTETAVTTETAETTETVEMNETAEMPETVTETESVEKNSNPVRRAAKASTLRSADRYTVNGELAFSLNMTKTLKESEGVGYTLTYTNPTNAQVINLCTKVYSNWAYGTNYTYPSILWCLKYYNEQWANKGVGYGIAAENKWEGLRQAVQYAIWYYSDNISLTQNSSNPIEKLAYEIMDEAWDQSGSTGNDVNFYCYQPDNTNAPNLVVLKYTSTGYIGSRSDYYTDNGSLIEGKAIMLTYQGEKKLGFCYQAGADNPPKDGFTYWYQGEVTNAEVLRILYNGYPANKDIINNLSKTGTTEAKLYDETQRALWWKLSQSDEGDTGFFTWLVNGTYGSTYQLGNLTLTMKKPPSTFKAYIYTCGSWYQQIVVTYDETPEKEEPETTSLVLTKTVKGRFADLDKVFEFTVSLKAQDGNALNETYAVETSAIEGVDAPTITDNQLTFSDGTATVFLKHGQTICIKDLPQGCQYEIRELEKESIDKLYTANIQVSASGEESEKKTFTGTKTLSEQVLNETEYVEYINTRQDIVPTGIRIDFTPLMIGNVLIILITVMVVYFHMYNLKNKRKDVSAGR